MLVMTVVVVENMLDVVVVVKVAVLMFAVIKTEVSAGGEDAIVVSIGGSGSGCGSGDGSNG